MGYYLLFWFGFLLLTASDDPAPGLRYSRDESFNMECERLSVEQAHRLYPNDVPAHGPRGDYYARSALVCKTRWMRPGLRVPADEAFLEHLEERARALSALAEAQHPELVDRTWMVEAHHSSGQVADKLAFATKNALLARGLRVTDRSPVLVAGDIQVLTRMPPLQAHPSACKRYFDNGSLGPGDALLAVLSLDARESALHAGICADGQWAWLQ